MAQLVKSVLPEAYVVIGGPDAGPRAQDLLNRHPYLDAVVEGDGEIPLLSLVRQFLKESPPNLEPVPALRHRGPAGVIANSGPSETLNLSELANVCEDLPGALRQGSWGWPYVLYETLRGCPYSCSYCMYGKTAMNEKSLKVAVEELLGLLKQGLTVNVIDPTFTTYKERAKQILRALSMHEYAGSLYFEAYPDSIDEEMARLMADARVSNVGLGFQTISSEGLKAVSRPKNLVRFERAVRLLRSHDISFYVDLIYGLPGTTVSDFFESIDYLYAQGIDIFSVMVYRLLGLPGSPMMADADKYGLVFSADPPYELLGSNTYSLQDIAFCERFPGAYKQLLNHLGSQGFARLAAPAGPSSIVKRFMADGLDSPEEFRIRLAS